MSFPPLATEITLLAVRLVDESPEPADVKAGWTAFAIFLLLLAAVAFLGFSLVKHLRRAQAAQDRGAYDDADQASGDRTDPPGQQPS